MAEREKDRDVVLFLLGQLELIDYAQDETKINELRKHYGLSYFDKEGKYHG